MDIQRAPDGALYLVDSKKGRAYRKEGGTLTVLNVAVRPGLPPCELDSECDDGERCTSRGTCESSTYAHLAIHAFGLDNVWVAGVEYDTQPKTGALHRFVNGVEQSVTSPTDYLQLHAIHALSPTDIWFGGTQVSYEYPQVLHWDGEKLEPDYGVESFNAIDLHAFSFPLAGVAFHWDGTAWTLR